MSLSHELLGPKILAKIKIYLLNRAELLFLFAMRYPVRLAVLLSGLTSKIPS
jgi:hypothetical protein